MPRLSPPRLRLAISLPILIFANLAMDVGLMWIFEQYHWGWTWLNEIYIGLLLGQLMLIGLWFGLGDGRWYVRLTAAVALTFGLVKAIWVAEILSTTSPDDDYAAMLVFILLPMMLTAGWVGFILRRTWSWRLTWQQIDSLPPTRQFQLGDAMLWMLLVAGALASIRFMVTLDDNFHQQFFDIALYTAKATIVVLAAVIFSFTAKIRWHTALLLAVTVLAIGAVFTIPETYVAVRQIQANATSPPTGFVPYIVTCVDEAKKQEAAVIAAALGAIANCLALRALRCGLMRPGVLST